MAKYRIKLDLSNFFNDQRNVAYVLMDPGWEYVTCLVEHIEKVFQIENVQLLTEDSCYLSPLESIEIIEKNDLLRVINLNINEDKKKRKISVSENQENTIQPIIINERRSLPKSNSTRKRKQLTNRDVRDQVNQSDNDTEKTVESINRISISSDSDSNLESTPRNQKRKRIRKSKNKSNSDSVITISVVDTSKNTNVLNTKTGCRNASYFKRPPHVRFDNNEDNHNAQETIWRNALNEIDSSPRQIRASIVKLNDGANSSLPKNKIHIIENILLSNIENNVINDNDNSVGDCNNQQEIVMEKTPLQLQSSFKISDILPLLESLKGRPEKDDLIVFKLRQDEESLSGYICGKFIEMDPENENILKLLIIDGYEEIPDNCSNLLRTEEGHLTYMIVNLNDMHGVGVYKFKE